MQRCGYDSFTVKNILDSFSKNRFNSVWETRLQKRSLSYERMFEFGQKHLNDLFVLDGIVNVSARDTILRKIISNSLAYRDYSNAYVAKMLIEKERIVIENGNRAHGVGALSHQRNLFCLPGQKRFFSWNERINCAS